MSSLNQKLCYIYVTSTKRRTWYKISFPILTESTHLRKIVVFSEDVLNVPILPLRHHQARFRVFQKHSVGTLSPPPCEGLRVNPLRNVCVCLRSLSLSLPLSLSLSLSLNLSQGALVYFVSWPSGPMLSSVEEIKTSSVTLAQFLRTTSQFSPQAVDKIQTVGQTQPTTCFC